jgi:hypothetical protein
MFCARQPRRHPHRDRTWLLGSGRPCADARSSRSWRPGLRGRPGRDSYFRQFGAYGQISKCLSLSTKNVLAACPAPGQYRRGPESALDAPPPTWAALRRPDGGKLVSLDKKRWFHWAQTDTGHPGGTGYAAAGWHEAKTSRIESAKQAPGEADIGTWCRVCGAIREVPDLIAASRAADSMYTEWRRLNRGGLCRPQEARRPLAEICDNLTPT